MTTIMRKKFPLVAIEIFFLLQTCCYLRCGGAPIGSGHTAGHTPMAVQGPEIWTVDGKPTTVAATYYLALPEGLQYTIDYQLPAAVAIPRDDASALPIAFPLMRHAYETGIYKRTSISKAGSGHLDPSRIGVALYHLEGARRHGYATALAISDLKQRIAASGEPAPDFEH